MKVRFPHHKKEVTLELPERLVEKVYRSKPAKPLTDREIKKGFASPIASPLLRKIAAGKKNAVIVVSDITRYIPYQAFLPILLEELIEGGIKPKQISFLIATGCHRPASQTEVEQILGKEIAKKFRILNHNAFEKSDLAYLGKTRKKTPVFVNKLYLKADLRVLTGLIEPHLIAGFSGGRKSICPGISGYETIKITHSPEFLESKNARNGNLRHNPFHSEITEVAERAGVDFIVNVVLNREKKAVGFFCGNYKKAFLEGCRLCQKITIDSYSRKHDLVITASGGYPLDLTFYQTSKGMVTAGEVVKKGGKVLVISGMEEGLGSQDFESLIKIFPGPEEFLKKFSKPENFTLDQWQIEGLLKVTEKATVYLYSKNRVPPLVERLGLKIVPDITAFLKGLIRKKLSIGLIPEGPFVLPQTSSKSTLTSTLSPQRERVRVRGH